MISTKGAEALRGESAPLGLTPPGWPHSRHSPLLTAGFDGSYASFRGVHAKLRSLEFVRVAGSSVFVRGEQYALQLMQHILQFP